MTQQLRRQVSSRRQEGLFQTANFRVNLIFPQFEVNKESIHCHYPTGETRKLDRHPYKETYVTIEHELQVAPD